jgi:predicted nuclease of predicted toxin-antitoxin system
MKLLFDQNLSYKLPQRVSDLFPESAHVRLLKLDQADDIVIWQYAKNEGFAILTQDSDFFDIAIMNGIPPKIIWLRTGNSSTNFVESYLQDNILVIRHFLADDQKICLELL